MFKELQPLVRKATLMIAIVGEGDNLRVSVTPMPTDSKDTPSLRPLSLVGSPGELDEHFAAALSEWQAPTRSLIEQVQDGADDKPPKADKAKKSTPAAKPAAPKAKRAASQPATDASDTDVNDDDDKETADETSTADADDVAKQDEPVAENSQPAATRGNPADPFTLDIF